MKKATWQRVAAALLMAVMLLGVAGCSKGEDGDIIQFTMFGAMPQPEINDDNEIMNLIAEKVGVKVKETWLTGQTAAEAIGTIIAGGDYPDFIDGGEAMMALYDEGVLVPWDDYLEKYPNLKELFTDQEWDALRQDDGKIYWANQFQNNYGENRATTHNDEAFWIQVRVLEWAGYPEINTLDEYYDVLTRYAEANPTMADGTKVIPYTMLCDDWRYFCIENAPQFLDGYPNDGSVIVDKENLKIVDYNTTPTAKRYFTKLNEEYKKGTIDIEFATQTYDEYIAKLSTGAVLGMCDQWWDFYGTVNDTFKQQGLDLLGCNYVPLGLTIDEGMDNRWHTYGDTLNVSCGIAVTTSCKDPDAAFKFMNDILDQEIHDLRFWGIKDVDYLVDEDGMFYKTPEMRMQWADKSYQASHRCLYAYMPQWRGTSRDGKNAMMPEEQTSEFFSDLAEPLRKCFEAYGANNYPDMIGSVVEENAPWFPMYSYSNAMTTATPGGVAWTKMGEVKHEWLPRIVMADDFEAAWEQYMAAYNAVNPQDFLSEMQEELNRRAS
ncbi:MAG: sugar ABC transporter substrate-binding protein [Oscillospiraceae bacterium]|nr:sugar ABC transporter substrate-binding protein [Oscillospiraceae bacterium]